LKETWRVRKKGIGAKSSLKKLKKAKKGKRVELDLSTKEKIIK